MQESGRTCVAEITSNLIPGITNANYYTEYFTPAG
jgi:hypothetical protein